MQTRTVNSSPEREGIKKYFFLVFTYNIETCTQPLLYRKMVLTKKKLQDILNIFFELLLKKVDFYNGGGFFKSSLADSLFCIFV